MTLLLCSFLESRSHSFVSSCYYSSLFLFQTKEITQDYCIRRVSRIQIFLHLKHESSYQQLCKFYSSLLITQTRGHPASRARNNSSKNKNEELILYIYLIVICSRLRVRKGAVPMYIHSCRSLRFVADDRCSKR